MYSGALKTLEFDRVVSVVAGLAVTPTGRARLAELRPLTDPARVDAAQRATAEGLRFLVDGPGLPLRAPADIEETTRALAVVGRPVEPLRLLGLADYLDSIDQSRAAIQTAGPSFPLLAGLVESLASFKTEAAHVRRAIEPSGAVADTASPALSGIRERLRKQRTRLRGTLESLLRGRETSKYLQEQVITDRNGRYVLVVRAEHRSAIPGVVHGASTSGASLFLEPLSTVEINNDIVAAEEQEAEEVRRILVALADEFRHRAPELHHAFDVATELDAIQAKGRFARLVDGVAPELAGDGTIELRAARHPLLIRAVRDREPVEREDPAGTPPVPAEPRAPADSDTRKPFPVPVEIRLIPPVRVLIVTGPNTGGKTVALKTTGLLAAMAQSGLHISAGAGSRLPVFRTMFADIGDEQSLTASLSTFSAHIMNIVSMGRQLVQPALVLLDEVGSGTDPAEGGALGAAIVDDLRRRGAHLIATTHHDALRSYASTTEGVVGAAFGFDADTFAPTYQLVYGSPGRSLAIEIAARLGMPATVITDARARMSDRDRQLAEQLAKMDREMRGLEEGRQAVEREQAALAHADQRLRTREETVVQREEALRRRLNEQLDERLRVARREIDGVIADLRTRASALTRQAAQPAGQAVSTGQAGEARAQAREAVQTIVDGLRDGEPPPETAASPLDGAAVVPGARVVVGALGLQGTVVHVHEGYADVDIRGKRLRAALGDLRVTAEPETQARVRLNVGLQPRDGIVSDLNVIGCTVDEALARTERFLDGATVTDQRSVRVIHGHGTGQLRRALAEFLKTHPLVASFAAAQSEQGGSGVTVVELKD